MARWDLLALKEAVEKKHGSDQAKVLNSACQSVVQRGAFAKYHFVEAGRLLGEATAAHADVGDMMMLFLGDNAESAAFQKARFQAAAHVTACVQSMHATADILAHAVYYALGMNLDPSQLLNSRQIGIRNVLKKLAAGPIHQQLNDLLDHDGFRYLDALNNHSKHRSIVDTPFSLDISVSPGPSGLKFSAFEYEGVAFPQCWAMPTLDAEYGRQSMLITGIGQALNSTLIP